MIEQEKEVTVIEIGKKVLRLEIRDFGSSDIDLEDLLQVQLNDIIEDIITFPVIFNRVAVLKAEVDDLLRQTQFDFHLLEAQLYEKHKKLLLGIDGKAPVKDTEAAVIRDPAYAVKKKDVFKVQKQADILDGLYWAAKSKDQKLNAISAKLKPEEFEKEILDKVINSVIITSRKNLFQNGRDRKEDKG